MSSASQRYLVEFDARRLAHRFTDILVLGGGLAGLQAAQAVPQSMNVLVVTKGPLQQSNSSYAQGGIASVLDPEDRIEWHVRDTLIAGANLCDPAAVQMVVSQGPDCIRRLVELGANFDSKGSQITLGREGGHSHNRIIHALGDATGQEIMRAVIATTLNRPNIDVFENAFTIDLLTDATGCRGALVHYRNETQMIWARQTILATGGAGQLYRETTNPAVATADGHAIAIRAGVEVRDMEFMQFHPTVLYIAGSSRSLITEAVRGEGAYLVDKDGYRFMGDYDSRLELAPRDIVSQAIVAQMEKTHHSNVYLDLSHLNAEFIRERFPGILQTCADFGIDITRDRVPVRPGAHYMIGGVTVDLDGRTSLPGLWAAGEVTSSGLHGANRLASNSLLEGVVYGIRAGQAASRVAEDLSPVRTVEPLQSRLPPTSSRPIDLVDIRNSLKSLMWRSVGVRRTASELEEASKTVQRWRVSLLTHALQDAAGWELRNMLDVAAVMIAAAQQRTESRGVHWRADHPKQDDAHWRQHVCFRGHETYLRPLPATEGVDKSAV
jgi:L-aspartate oxidase